MRRVIPMDVRREAHRRVCADPLTAHAYGCGERFLVEVMAHAVVPDERPKLRWCSDSHGLLLLRKCQRSTTL